MNEFPKAWTVVFVEHEGKMWLARNHRGGKQTLLREAEKDWIEFFEVLAR